MRRDEVRWSGRRALVGWLAIGVALSVALLAWFASRALAQWRHSSALMLERRADDMAGLLVAALTRDMAAVQASVLSSVSWDEYMNDVPTLMGDVVASTFARYPYPAMFFDWHAGSGEGVRFYTRSDRLASWMVAEPIPHRFPVTVVHDHGVAELLEARLLADAARRARFSTFQVTIAGIGYQVVSRLYYQDQYHERLRGVLGFMVDLPWARQHYFPDITSQVFRVSSAASRLSMTVLDSEGALVARSVPVSGLPPGVTATARRSFESVFFDPRLVATERPPDMPAEDWSVEVSVYPDPPLATAILQARRTLVIAGLAAITLAFGLALSARAARASVRLAELRGEFVATVTHELKAPIGTMRVIGETLVSGRVDNAVTRRDYGQLIVQEAKRLTLLVDNLLALSRVTDVAEMYSFERISVRDLMLSVLQQFTHQLELRGFGVTTDLPADLPAVSADRSAIQLALDNIVYNAIRYSGEVCAIDVSARRDGRGVRIVIADRGSGIPEDEIEHVTRKFFRGRDAVQGGSGLGLAIAQRIIADHGGQLEIRSEVGRGTAVGVYLPAAVEDHEDTGG